VRLGSWPGCIELDLDLAAVVLPAVAAALVVADLDAGVDMDADVAPALVVADLDAGVDMDADVAPACSGAVAVGAAVWVLVVLRKYQDPSVDVVVNWRIAYQHWPSAAPPAPWNSFPESRALSDYYPPLAALLLYLTRMKCCVLYSWES
jgi:hypothetical protein